MSLPLHGETVQVTSITCVPRGFFKEYEAQIQFHADDNMKSITRKLTFRESVAETFRAAGHTQVTWSLSYKIIDMAQVDVVLDGSGDSLNITSVYASNGTVYHVEADKRKERQDSRKDYEGLSISQQMGLAQKRKQEAHIAALEAKHAKYFGEASKALMAWFLDKPYMPESAAA